MHRSKLIAALILSTALAPLAPAEPPGPIHVIIDVHCDPMLTPTIPGQLAQYLEWVDTLDAVLDASEPYGARISFLSTGQFMEWVLAEPDAGLPVIERLYESGDMIGTHSHKHHRVGAFNWEHMGPAPQQALLDKQWNDHISMVDAVVVAVIEAAGGVPDPIQIRAVNTVRGAWLDDDALRIQMMADRGFTVHEQGPGEIFAMYFGHYAWNAFRPSGEGYLVHDPDGPVIASPFGPVLGHDGMHFGFEQDMTVPAVQARFLMEVLNWLDDVHVEQTGRVWTAGWSAHTHDFIDDELTGDAWGPMLQWMSEHFVNGDLPAATFSTMVESRDDYLAWEAAHPGETPFSYAPDETDLDAYPYLFPVWRYMAGARYAAAEPPVETVRWHAVETADGRPLWMLYAYDGYDRVVDLSPHLPPGAVAAIDPRTGRFVLVPPAAVPVGRAGTMLVPAPDALILAGFADLDGDGAVGFSDLMIMLAEWGPCDEPALPGACLADLSGNGLVGMQDLLILLGQWGDGA